MSTTATTPPTPSAPPAPNAAVQAFLSGGPKKLYIGGKWADSQKGKTFKAMNPATGQALAEVQEADAADVDAAVKAAREAFDKGPWPKMNPGERAKILWKIADLIEKNFDELAELETLNNGKPINEARRGDLPLVIENFRYWAGWPTKIMGETYPTTTPYAPKLKAFAYTVKEPVGVVAAIIPWNFPLQMAAWKIAPALACGCVVILKPAEQTPLSALRLAQIIEEAGVPPGVFQVVNGAADTGRALVKHAGVDKVSFTGSTEVGKEIIKDSIGNLKRVSLELGGKSPQIIFADADLDVAMKSAYMGIFYNQGQLCCAGSRIFVEKPAYEELAAKIADRAKKVKLGPGIDPKTQMGPLVSEEQLARVQKYVEIGKSEGAKLMAGGDRPAGDLGKGYFMNPTVFTDVKDTMRIAQEEIFGPVAALMPFESMDEVVSRSNASQYGLAAGVWTKDVKKAFRAAEALRCGMVWINTFNLADVTMPWGGVKSSGWGRETGHEAIRLYTEVKTVWVDLN
ncbi:MAG: aldehyde dehydrogenase family protein [Elusimicrobia bacterium]|nr:aldehyde dehydrogenase family protein [Elusimicrobiota bacterium]